MSSINDKFTLVGTGTVTNMIAPGKAIGAATMNINSATNWPTATAVYFAIRTISATLVTSINPSGQVPGTYTEWKGTLSGTTISNLTLQSGTDQIYAAGTNTQVFIDVSAPQMNSLVNGVLVQHNQDGTHGAITGTSISITGNLSVGGTVTGITPAKIYNPYKFSAYLSTSQGISASTWTKAQVNTKEFDTGSNFDNVTNYRFTAPVAGFYAIMAQIGLTDAGASPGAIMLCALYKNGVSIIYSTSLAASGNTSSINRAVFSKIFQFAAGDYIEIYAYISEAGRSISGGKEITYISGFLVSQT